MGEYADREIDRYIGGGWGRRRSSEGRRSAPSRAKPSPATADDFPLLEVPLDELLDRLAEAEIAYREYACFVSGAERDAARQAVKDRLK